MTNPYSFVNNLEDDNFQSQARIVSQHHYYLRNCKGSVCLKIANSRNELDEIFPPVLSNVIISYLPCVIEIHYNLTYEKRIFFNNDEKIYIDMTMSNNTFAMYIKSLGIYPPCHQSYISHYMKSWFDIDDFLEHDVVAIDERESNVDRIAFYNEAWIFKLFYDIFNNKSLSNSILNLLTCVKN